MEKKKRGRRPIPGGQRKTMVAVMLMPSDIDLLDDVAKREGVSRSQLVRRMMEPELLKLRKGSVYYDDLQQWNERRR